MLISFVKFVRNTPSIDALLLPLLVSPLSLLFLNLKTNIHITLSLSSNPKGPIEAMPDYNRIRDQTWWIRM